MDIIGYTNTKELGNKRTPDIYMIICMVGYPIKKYIKEHHRHILLYTWINIL